MARKLKKSTAYNKKGKIDITFLTIVLVLLTVGLVMLFSASYAYSLEYYNNSYKFIVRQSIFAAVGIAAMVFLANMDYHIWRKWAWVIFVATIGILVLLLILPPMISGMDVKRWLVIGSFSFQPSEVAKFAIILLFSSLIISTNK